MRRQRRRNKVVLVSGSETQRERTTERRRRRRRPNRVVVLRATKENPMSETMSHHAIEFSSSLQKKHRILREKTTKRWCPSYHVNTKFTLSLSFLLFSSVQQEQQQRRRELPNCFCDVIFAQKFFPLFLFRVLNPNSTELFSLLSHFSHPSVQLYAHRKSVYE